MAADDAEHRSMLTVRPAVFPTRSAAAADRVDLAHHASSHKLVGSGFDDADELVTEYSGEWVVTANNLQVGVTNPGSPDSDAGLAGRQVRGWNVSHLELSILEPDRLQR
jgi:hypothetical protein